jgi:hypothetical protein
MRRLRISLRDTLLTNACLPRRSIWSRRSRNTCNSQPLSSWGDLIIDTPEGKLMKAPGLENNNPDMDYQKEAHEFVNSFPLGGLSQLVATRLREIEGSHLL